MITMVFIILNINNIFNQLPGIDCAWVHPPTKEKYSLLVKFDKVTNHLSFLNYLDYLYQYSLLVKLDKVILSNVLSRLS